MNQPASSHILRIADLSARHPTSFVVAPNAEARAAFAADLGILGVRKLKFEGALAPFGQSDWRLEATISATVVQECVVTLAPVSTRIVEDVVRHYGADVEMPDEPGESEMPEDETLEPLPETVDLTAVMMEALALNLPAYPRADDAALVQSVYTEPGKTPMTDADAKPFAGLAALKAAMGREDGGTGDE